MINIRKYLADFFKEYHFLLRDALKEAFFFYSFRILAREIAPDRMQVIFYIKVKKNPKILILTAQEIIEDDQYFYGLSKQDRIKVKEQYLVDIARPKAFIEEYPLIDSCEGKAIFKIMCVDENKIICGTASYFFQKNKEILPLLSSKDIISLAFAYYQERFLLATSGNFLSIKKNFSNVGLLK